VYTLYRTHRAGWLTPEDVGSQVILNGWVKVRRDLGQLIFIQLRDRYGVIQLVFDPQHHSKPHQIAETLRPEYVIAVKGVVQLREEKNINPDMATGKIEVMVTELECLSDCPTPAFEIEEEVTASEELRMKYRYLDLRRECMTRHLINRHRIVKAMRTYLDAEDFLEIETPMLGRSTPEGARDFLVPSRIREGDFYALPQSPQLLKQILMVSGMDRYYQIARCFRDEDLRADRQFEFTQLDLEMSFVREQDVMNIMEGVCITVMKDVYGKDLETPFPTYSFEEVMDTYGTDKPDLRFGLPIITITDDVKHSEFGVFQKAVASGGRVAGINAKGAAGFSRKDIESLQDELKPLGAKGLAWLKYVDGAFSGPIAKFFSENELKQFGTRFDVAEHDLLLFVADNTTITRKALGYLRNLLGHKLGLIDEGVQSYLWVVDFPLFEKDEETQVWEPAHHAFTQPAADDIPLLKTNPEAVRALHYDLVLNGVELGSGSIRIHDSNLQQQVFDVLNISTDEAQRRFGFFLNALKHGCPPHGGFALGLDRYIMINERSSSIRDVIAFPKTTTGVCPLTDAPSSVEKEQLEELSLRLIPVKKQAIEPK
jgi:aspartyl-tRNA synthetase